MAITPFTQPVQQGEFIPQEPRLPVDAAIQGAAQLQKQDIQARDRLRQVMDKVAQQSAADVDRDALRQLEQRYRDQFDQIAEDERFYNDQARIQEMARDASNQLQYIQQNRENIQEQMEKFEDADLEGGQQRVRELQEAFLQNAGLEMQDGRIDPQSVFSPQSIGDEELPVNKAKELAKELPETDFGENIQVDEQTGEWKITESDGVTRKRIKDWLSENLTKQSGVQNWMQNEMTRLVSQKGYSPEQAQKHVRQEVNNQASNVINNFSYIDRSRSRRDREDTSVGGDDYQPAISTPGRFRDPDNYQSSTRKEELSSHESWIENKAAEKMFGKGPQDVNVSKVQEIIQNPERYVSKTQYGQGRHGEIGVKRSEEEMKIAALRKEVGPDVADRYANQFQETKKQIGASEGRVRFVSPFNDKRMTDIEQKFSGMPEQYIDSVDLQTISEESDSWYIPFDKSDVSDLKQQLVNYGNMTGFSQDGREVEFRVPNTEKVDSDLRGERVVVQLNDQGQNTLINAGATALEESGDPYTAQALNLNKRYNDRTKRDNTPIKTSNSDYSPVLKVGEEEYKGEARYNPDVGKNGAYEVRYNTEDEDNEPVTFGTVLNREGLNNDNIGVLSQKAASAGLGSLADPMKMNKAIKLATGKASPGDFSTKAEDKNLRTMGRTLLNTSIPYKHKGQALHQLNQLSQ